MHYNVNVTVRYTLSKRRDFRECIIMSMSRSVILCRRGGISTLVIRDARLLSLISTVFINNRRVYIYNLIGLFFIKYCLMSA